MITCPISNEFDQLVEFAKAQGLGANAEFQAYRAYMMINQDLPMGEEPVIPTNDEFLAIMDSINVFTKDGPNRQGRIVSVIKRPTAVKPGVEELFESNPELANAVYEALGFNDFTNKEKEELIEQLRNPLFDLVRGTELYNKYKGETIPYGYSENSWKLLISGINESKLDLNKILLSYKKRLSEEENTPIRETGIDEKTGLPKGFNPSTGQFEGGFGELSEKENAINKSNKKIAVLEKFINKKQQAQQLYSQYLDTGKQDIEGFKEFVAQGETVLTPQPGSKDYYEDVENAFPQYKVVKNPIPFDDAHIANDRARSIVNILAEKLSHNTGVPVQFITAEEALEITKDVNQWSGQPAFYYGDTVYIIPDLATPESVLHEFAHPIIRSIYINNKPLFDKLVSDLSKTETGKEIIKRAREAYPTADENDPVILEEALVMALTESAVKKEDSAFNKFISNLLYAIKQLLRKVFGKVKVENLDANTTLAELGDMLVMESFALDNEALSREDIAAYMTEVKDYIKGFEKIKNRDIENLVNDLYDRMSTHISVVKNNKDYAEMKKILSNYYNTSDLEQIRKVLGPYQTLESFMNDKLNDVQGDLNFAKNRVSSFVDSLLTLRHVVDKVNASIGELTKDVNVKDNVAKVMYINNILDSWDKFIDQLQDIIASELNEGNIESNNPIVDLVGGIKNQINAAQKNSNKIYKSGVYQQFIKTLTPMKEKIDAKFKSIQDYLVSKGASPERIAQHQADYYGLSGKQLQDFLRFKAMVESGQTLTSIQKENYEILKKISYREGAYLTDEKIQYLMEGRLGDASAINSFLEMYMNNQDPLVFGLATFVKDTITDAYTKAQELGNAFLNDIKPIVQRAGFDQSNPASFFKKLTFRDRRGGFSDKGEFQTEEVISYINPWKDFRGDIMKMDHEIRVATEQALASGNTEEVFRLKQEREAFRAKYLHRDYTDEYYDRFKIFRRGDNDVVGAKAERLRDELLAEIQRLTDYMERSQSYNRTDEEETELEVLWERWRDLHSEYDKVGKPKSKEDREIAARLREFRDASRDLYEMVPMPGFFEQSLKNYEDYLVSQTYKKGDPAFINLRNAWIRKNTRVKIKDSWYKRQEEIWNEINAIMAKVPKNQQEEINLAKYQKQLQDLLSKYKDEDNQPEGTAMSEELIAKIKSTQAIIDDIKNNLESSSGLTKAESKFLSAYFEEVNAGLKPSNEDYNYAQELLAKRSKNGLGKEDKSRLNALFAELEEIRESTPTQYYLDVINNAIYNQIEKMKALYGFNTITAENANVVLTEEFYKEIVESDPDFKEWFDKNHRFKSEMVDNELSVKIERVKVWSVNRPKDPFYYEKFSYINSEGKKEVVLGMPTMKFYERRIKDKYVTKQVSIAEAIEKGDVELANWDEKIGWLPRLDIDDNRYKNEKYFEIKKDKALFDALKAMTKWHFKFQEGNTKSSRLLFDVPRYRKSTADSRLEYITGDGKQENPISRWWRRVKSMFVASPDDYDQGYNLDDQVMLMEGELYNDENAGIPITGLSKLQPDDVSLDLTFSMLKYMMSGQKQQKLIEINPMVRALQVSLKNPDIEKAVKETKNIAKSGQRNRGFWTFASEKLSIGKTEKQSARVKAIDNFIEREFEGKTNLGLFGNENVFISKLADNITKLSAFGYFALDIPGAIRNNMSARIQSLQEAVGGLYYNTSEYAKGSVWANRVVADISMNLYKFGSKSLNVQLTEIFDVASNRFEDKFADHGSRSVTRDALKDLSWMTSFRQLGEMSTAFSVFAAMMYHEKNVTRTVNGVTSNISYMDAWESVDGQIRLKDGVDPEWGTEGAKFKAFKNKVQGVINNLNGAYSKFDYAEADRYFAWRWLTFLRRFFTKMFLNRYQYRGSIRNPRYRYDAALQDTVMGFHVEGVRAIYRGIKSRGDYLKTLTPSEKVALLKITVDIAYGFMFMMLISWLFGYDEEDDERFKKIRERSGPLPFFGVSEDEKDFNLGGWLTNHALLLTFQLRNETMQWMPVTAIGFDSYADVIQWDALATKNTFENYKKMGGALTRHIGHALFGTDDSKAYWDQREGPYEWTQEDGSKFWSYLFRSIGLTGRSVDSGTALINHIKSQNWK